MLTMTILLGLELTPRILLPLLSTALSIRGGGGERWLAMVLQAWASLSALLSNQPRLFPQRRSRTGPLFTRKGAGGGVGSAYRRSADSL